ncbi:hypothetical protein [Deinococcus humi]|uniref:Chromosome segregation ATPase n=1 Tax=Deinococcus humi TaxID=662880 RepID=A0A7W8JSR1_9DEIO|nr:hypothetical protein [Deinococcus humi]MBB5362078.1 chromosome segregation ATPase [Deinococcus humi]GGO22164.1 hypothetical protein GCM10008949_09170 [Deinococcus humi]
MKNLKTVTPVFAGGKWLPAGSPLPGDLSNFDYEKHAARGLIEDTEGAEIRNPSAQMEALESLADTELDTLRQKLAEAQKERDAFAAEKDRLIESAQSLAAHVHTNEKALAELGTERDALTSQLAAAQARPMLPEDALARLIDVKGVGEKLAPVILDALTAPAKAD